MKTTELKFHEITLEDKAWMDARYGEEERYSCESSFANNYLWRSAYHVEVVEINGCLVLRMQSDGNTTYSYPVGAGDKKQTVEQLLAYCREQGEKLTLQLLEAKDREQLLEWFPGQFLIDGNRDSYDYIYLREKLATLSGKKLHGKRNHIARFKDGDDWSYEEVTPENLEECRSMTYRWMRMRTEKWSEEMETEVMVLHDAFDHFEELGLVGGVLRKAGEMVAFTMGEALNSETFVVHFEKAYPDMQGAYPMINQQFVLHACQNYNYVNREEDTGDMGLRKAKLSYYPEILLEKYTAVESRVVFADSSRDRAAIMKIWQTCFGDDEEYISDYLENRMTEDNMLAIYEDGQMVSMASFLPALCRNENGDVPVRYVYAVATLPEYRNRGYAAEILSFAKEKYEEVLVLSPAGEELTAYYEKLGFQRSISRCQITNAVDVETTEERGMLWMPQEVNADIQMQEQLNLTLE